MAGVADYVRLSARRQRTVDEENLLDDVNPHTRTFEAGDGVTAMTVSGANIWLALANGGVEVRDAHSGCIRHSFAAPARVGRTSVGTRVWCVLGVVDETIGAAGQGSRRRASSAIASCRATATAMDAAGRTHSVGAGEPQVWMGLSTGAIEVYSAASFVLLRRLCKHLSGVYCLAAEQCSGVGDAARRVVYSGSSDFEIAQWRLHDGQLLRLFRGHSNYVRCLYAEGAVVVSGSDDGTVRVWAKDSGDTISVGDFHRQAAARSVDGADRGGVSALCRVGVHMWSGDASGTLVIWSLRDCRAVQLSRPHTARVTTLQKVGSQVYSGSADGTMCVFAAVDGTLSQRLDGAAATAATARVTAIQCAVEVDRFYLWTGAADNTVRCWHHDEHHAMTDERERFNDMRWYYATQQPFRASNEELLDTQRELAELAVLCSGSEEAVQAYLARTEEGQRSLAARYWSLQTQQASVLGAAAALEAESRALEDAVAAKQKALDVARANVRKLLDAQQSLHASRATAATAPAIPLAAPVPIAGVNVQTALPVPPLPGAVAPAPPAPPAAPAAPVAVVVTSPLQVPAPALPAAAPATAPATAPAAAPAAAAAPTPPDASAAVVAAASPAPPPVPAPPVAPAAESAVSKAVPLLSAQPSWTTPLPGTGAAMAAVLPVVSTVAAIKTTPLTAAHSASASASAVNVVRSTSYEPDLSSLPPPPPLSSSSSSASVKRVVAVPVLQVVPAPTLIAREASTALMASPLSESSSSPLAPLTAVLQSPAPPTVASAAPPAAAVASTPFVVPPPPPAVVPLPPPGMKKGGGI